MRDPHDPGPIPTEPQIYEPPPARRGGTVIERRGVEDFLIAVLIVCSILGWILMVLDR